MPPAKKKKNTVKLSPIRNKTFEIEGMPFNIYFYAFIHLFIYSFIHLTE